ncbi:MAG TPA: hypothetical protein VGO36_03550 [Solirubrobacterales bacterium]|jgi:hypothetical protein|nr:hypothetical protein [Solirubrobacterales bacterium]
MPDYQADPDIRAVLESRFAFPPGIDVAEAERLDRFLRCDQVLERFYVSNPPAARPPEGDLLAAASTAMAAYDNRSEALPVGWQKLLVLQAGVAGGPDNLDSFEIQKWAYTRIVDENPNWLGDFDEDVDRGKPLRWLTQLVGVRVVMARESERAVPASAKKKRWFGR